jgi:hypothetical protein
LFKTTKTLAILTHYRYSSKISYFLLSALASVKLVDIFQAAGDFSLKEADISVKQRFDCNRMVSDYLYSLLEKHYSIQ